MNLYLLHAIIRAASVLESFNPSPMSTDTYSVELIGSVVEHNVKVTFQTGPSAG